MTERKFIKQLKTLQEIKPEKEWAFLAKQEILGREDAQAHWFSLHRQAFLVGSLAGIVLMVVGVAGWQALQQPKITDLVQYEILTDSLKQLGSNLEKITIDLHNVKNASQALAVSSIVKTTIAQSEELLAAAKDKGGSLKPTKKPQEEVLSVLVDVESALSAMKEASQLVQKEITERELKELEGAVLTEKQQALLAKAKEYLSQENYPQALEKIIEISQIQ